MLTVFIFAVLNEALLEYFLGNNQKLKPFLPLISLLTSILLTFGFQMDLFTLVLGFQSYNPFWTLLFSAFIIARVSNYLNDFVQKVLGGK